MRILIFNWRDIKNSWAGGSELYIHELARRWKKAGNDVAMFSAQDPLLTLPEKEIVDGITIYRKGGRFSVYFWACVYYFKKLRHQADLIVDIENGIPFFTPFYSRKKKIALVYHVHGNQFFYELPFPISTVGYVLEKYFFPFVYRNIPLIAISKSTREKLIALGFKKQQISIVTPGVNSMRRMKKVKKYKNPTLLYLGRIKKYKRLDLLIDIFPEILKKIPNAKLIVAGWGTEAPQIIDVVMKNGFRRSVSLYGPVSEKEKRELYQRSWAMVNPSLHEGWGITVIEGNYFGTPTIAFNVPGLSDAIKDNVTGFLCRDKKDMVTTIVDVLKSKRLRKTIGKNAKVWSEKLTWNNSAALSLDLLKK